MGPAHQQLQEKWQKKRHGRGRPGLCRVRCDETPSGTSEPTIGATDRAGYRHLHAITRHDLPKIVQQSLEIDDKRSAVMPPFGQILSLLRCQHFGQIGQSHRQAFRHFVEALHRLSPERLKLATINCRCLEDGN